MSKEYSLLKNIETDGGNIVICKHAGTEMCQHIHTKEGCFECPIMEQILKQLNEYEELRAQCTVTNSSYLPLTKKTVDQNGKVNIVSVYGNTNKAACAIIGMLNAYEALGE